jgi:DNA-binding NarL/FixJ family response regulator
MALGRPTQRQIMVLEALARGRRPEEIAATLHISRDTVYEYLESCRNRLGARTNYQLMVIAERLGLLGKVAMRLDPRGP